jgi:hypothetical protein
MPENVVGLGLPLSNLLATTRFGMPPFPFLKRNFDGT